MAGMRNVYVGHAYEETLIVQQNEESTPGCTQEDYPHGLVTILSTTAAILSLTALGTAYALFMRGEAPPSHNEPKQ